MSKTYRAWEVDQGWLLPASIHDFVATDHPAHLVREIVRGELDADSLYQGGLKGYIDYPTAEEPAVAACAGVGARDRLRQSRPCLRSSADKGRLTIEAYALT